MRRRHGFALHLHFLLQDAQRRQIIFHLLKTDQHRLTICRHAGIVNIDGLLLLRASGAAVKQGQRQGGRPQRPITRAGRCQIA